MAILGVDDMKAKLVGGGARPNLFKVTMAFPSYVTANVELASYMCKATSMPASTIAPIEVPFRGRQLKLAGDSRTFGSWNMTILNDTDFKIYRAFERWMNGINNMTDNEGLTNPNDYQVDGFVDHLDRDGNSIKQYQLRGCFPTSLDGIALSYGTNDAVEDFGVTLAYQYFETDTTT